MTESASALYIALITKRASDMVSLFVVLMHRQCKCSNILVLTIMTC